MQRLGRKGYPTYRMVVQDERQSPTSGKVIALIGNYNPHTKEANIDKEVATKFLSNGAHPSPRAVALLKSQGVKIPKWVKSEKKTQKPIKNSEKLRKNRPAEDVKSEKSKEVEAPAETPETEVTEDKAEAKPEESATDVPAEESAPESDKKEPTKEA